MNISDQLPPPINSYELDVPASTYYDFELPEGSDYPLAGVTYPVDYGNMPGYTAEDGHELDLFVGNQIDGLMGSVIVFRGHTSPDERKFYVALDQKQLEEILNQLQPVLRSHEPISNIESLLMAIELYKDK